MSSQRQFAQKAVLARMGKFVSSGWFVEGDEVSNLSRRSLVIFNILANITANLTGGNFFAGLLIILQADDAFIGLVTMLTFGANLLQLVTPMLLERFKRRKKVLMLARGLAYLLNIAFIGLIPYLPASSHSRLVFLGFSVLLVNALGAFIGPGFSVWHIAHIPGTVRVQYFSLITMLNGIFIAVFNLLGSGVVDLFKQEGRELLGLSILRMLALVLAGFELLMLSRIKELPSTAPPMRIKLRALLTELFRQPAYLRSVLVIILWSFVVNLPGSYYTVYLLRDLRFSYATINLVASLNVAVLILLTFAWRKIFMKYNWFRPLAAAILLFAPHYILLAFVSDGLFFLYPLGMILSFVCLSGINLAFAGVGFINIPKEKQTLYIGFYSTANFLAALAAATLSRYFVQRFHGLRFTLLGVPFGEKQLLMLIVGVLMALAGLVILRVAGVNRRQGLEH